MYKVLIVDDEVNILEGIATLVDWESCETSLHFKASNGKMAYEMITKDAPDIVITDIKMPGMNGVELIQNVYRVHPDIKFIVLSGYDEFQFAKTAMECNVKHYLLKPSNEKKIEEALKQVVAELKDKEQKEDFLEKMRTNLKRVLPKAKEQFLKEYITNKKYGVKDWRYYSQLFGVDTTVDDFKLIVLTIDNKYEYEHLFALKEMITNNISENRMIPLSTTIGEKIVILTEDRPTVELVAKLKQTSSTFKEIFGKSNTAAISNPGPIIRLRTMYNEALNCLTQRFYLTEGSIITANDIENIDATNELQYDHEDVIFMIRSGNLKKVQKYLDDFFKNIQNEMYEAGLVKSHCLELFLAIIRQANRGKMDALFKQTIHFHKFSTFEEIKKFIENVAIEITEYHFKKTRQNHSQQINRVIEYVDENLSDTELSLSRIANNILYMNSDYLGKLFKKETGERFSNYLINRRIEKAIKIIEQSDNWKVFEIAEAVGFGNNPRYFGQVFKKYTGVTPSDYHLSKPMIN
ncbi:response regulator transcription factor [Pseudalkalibacillus salsuginis]|uniref:response regulator transcription factor n=1 Tax=Pseudalkalibacillus salsuginis TaxID=2910972 RepID=UPI001F3246CB|nr:response regulator [Pseudalkalibacillus salsuginis]MCF6408433.1 response regulator [Pseudalkalibacillus salsuginis]